MKSGAHTYAYPIWGRWGCVEEKKKGNKAAGLFILEQMPRDLVSSNTKYNKIFF